MRKAVVGFLLFLASVSAGQYYTLQIDSQVPSESYIFDRAYTGNHLYLRAAFYENRSALNLSATWNMYFCYASDRYVTNPIATSPVGTWLSSNTVSFATTNIVFNSEGNYFFRITGTNSDGFAKTWARGPLIVERTLP